MLHINIERTKHAFVSNMQVLLSASTQYESCNVFILMNATSPNCACTQEVGYPSTVRY